MHQLRVTGVLLDRGRLLLVRQKVSPERRWSLPGGHVEEGETLQDAIVREIGEETGLQASILRLLYVADKPEDRLLHITFELRRCGGELQLPSNAFDANPISDVRFVALDELGDYGFSEAWCDRVATGFPDAPAYVGHKSNVGL